jgi:hypothetical protein
MRKFLRYTPEFQKVLSNAFQDLTPDANILSHPWPTYISTYSSRLLGKFGRNYGHVSGAIGQMREVTWL